MSISQELIRGAALTPSEVQIFEGKYIQRIQAYPSFALSCDEYLRKVYDRIRKIEQSCNVWRPGHLVLLRMALDLDESSFDKVLEGSYLWVDAVNFAQAGAPVMERFFIAVKLLIGVPEAVVVEEEVRRYLAVTRWRHCCTCGYEWKKKGEAVCPKCESKDVKNLQIGAKGKRQAEVAARKRVQRARSLTKILSLYLIRGFAREFAEKAVPADVSCWTRVS